MIFKSIVQNSFSPLVVRFTCLILTIGSVSLVTTHGYAAQVNYALWEKVLNTYVDDHGYVNYEGLKSNRSPLDNFIKNEIENRDINTFSDTGKKAFWINAYNALTMRLIIDHYPLRLGGIRTINWGRPWDVKWKVSGRTLTLSQIEHEILRKWNPIDPRIHFVINCASIGCPRIPDTHFNPEQLEEQLDRETVRFINDTEKVRLDRSNNVLYHSAIFNWFEEDFFSVSSSKLEFILKYLNEADKKYILLNKERIQLKEMKYDWALNKQ